MQVLMMQKRIYLIMVVIIKKGENVNHADFDDAKKRIYLIMIVIIKKEENVNHAGFDDAKKNLLDNGCHHKKRGRM